jgi:hypothetical protein
VGDRVMGRYAAQVCLPARIDLNDGERLEHFGEISYNRAGCKCAAKVGDIVRQPVMPRDGSFAIASPSFTGGACE